VKVVLQWTAPEGGFGFVQMDNVANEDLDDVEDEECESKLLNHGLDPHEGGRSSTL